MLTSTELSRVYYMIKPETKSDSCLFKIDAGRFVTQINDLTQFSFSHRHLRLLRYRTRHQRLLKKPWRLMAATVEPTYLPHQVIKLKKCANDRELKQRRF